MFPSANDQLFGVFVKNFKHEMESQDIEFPKTSLIRGKSRFGLVKAFKYLAHYISVIRNYFTFQYHLVYIHFLTHHIPLLILLIPFKKHPFVLNFHGSDLHLILHNRFVNFWAKLVLRKMDLLIVPTEYLKDQLLEIYAFLKPEKIYVSPSGGIDGKLFYNLPEDKPVTKLRLGFVSRLTEEKGWRTFLEALT
jgi:glycosyltransferase involved in cell wall biosynthesis